MIAGALRCLDRGCSRDERKTRKVVQEEYEALYTGKRIEYDNRLSVLISMIWVVMMFSAAIPTLYLAGCLLCFFTYWTDKFLLLKFYRTPPKHGSNLAHRARNIIEFSLLVHLFTGLYMLSNPDIFVGEEEEKPTGFFAWLSEVVTVGVRALSGVESARFKQAHVIFYAIGTGFFVAFFVIEKITGFFSRVMGRACCCCLNRDTVEEQFSDNIFCEMDKSEQGAIVSRNKENIKIIDKLLKEEAQSEFLALRQYYKARLLYKKSLIKYYAEARKSLTGGTVSTKNETAAAFFSANKSQSN